MQLKIHDQANLLSSADRSALESAATSWRFETHVLIQHTAGSAELDDAAHAAITTPNTVVIAVDPQRHHTAVRFGSATHVKPGDYDSISKAGNAHFRAGEWGAGLAAIGTRAEASAESRVAMSVSNEPVVIEKGLSTGTWVGIALLFGAVVTCLVVVLRKMRRQQAAFASTSSALIEEASEYRGRNMDAADQRSFDERLTAFRLSRGAGLGNTYSTASGYYPQAPAPVIVNGGGGGGGNDLLTGVLIGEQLGGRQSTREVIYEERVVDAGGGGSFWDSGSSGSDDTSVSDDAGGSDSSYDSGSDSGGGSDGGDSGW